MSDRLYLDAELRPRRSMTRDGLQVVLLLMILVNLVLMAGFTLTGAAPVPIFLGLDVLGLAVAFHFSSRPVRNVERVRVSAERVVVEELGPQVSRELWNTPTAFTRVVVDDLGEEEWRVRVFLSGKKLTLGRSLSAPERAQLGRDLDTAIRSARNERYPSSNGLQ